MCLAPIHGPALIWPRALTTLCRASKMCAYGHAKHSCTSSSSIKLPLTASKKSASDLEQHSAEVCEAEDVLLAQIRTAHKDWSCSTYIPGLMYRSALLPAAALEPASMSWLARGVCLAACNQYLVMLLPEDWHHFLST